MWFINNFMIFYRKKYHVCYTFVQRIKDRTGESEQLRQDYKV